jgi:ribulose-5-phosphate 4-epimerase/fuculose-1-phosphate aldolase
VSVHPLSSARAVDSVLQAKIHLAAAHRLAVLHELEEGIDNHFTVTVPGCDGQHLILPFGLHWSEARASDMIVFDEAGKTLEGEGVVGCRRSAYMHRSIESATYGWCCTRTSHGH